MATFDSEFYDLMTAGVLTADFQPAYDYLASNYLPNTSQAIAFASELALLAANGLKSFTTLSVAPGLQVLTVTPTTLTILVDQDITVRLTSDRDNIWMSGVVTIASDGSGLLTFNATNTSGAGLNGDGLDPWIVTLNSAFSVVLPGVVGQQQGGLGGDVRSEFIGGNRGAILKSAEIPRQYDIAGVLDVGPALGTVTGRQWLVGKSATDQLPSGSFLGHENEIAYETNGVAFAFRVPLESDVAWDLSLHRRYENAGTFPVESEVWKDAEWFQTSQAAIYGVQAYDTTVQVTGARATILGLAVLAPITLTLPASVFGVAGQLIPLVNSWDSGFDVTFTAALGSLSPAIVLAPSEGAMVVNYGQQYARLQ